jgi:hypothetical protein
VRVKDVRKQYSFWAGEDGLDAWDVDNLIELARDLPVEEVALEYIGERSALGGDRRNPSGDQFRCYPGDQKRGVNVRVPARLLSSTEPASVLAALDTQLRALALGGEADGAPKSRGGTSRSGFKSVSVLI